MYSDEMTGEAADSLEPSAKKAVMRSSSEVSDQAHRMSGSGEHRASVASAQVSMHDDSGSNRASLLGSATGSASISTASSVKCR